MLLLNNDLWGNWSDSCPIAYSAQTEVQDALSDREREPKDMETDERLQIDLPRGGTEDTDESIIVGAMARQTVGKM